MKFLGALAFLPQIPPPWNIIVRASWNTKFTSTKRIVKKYFTSRFIVEVMKYDIKISLHTNRVDMRTHWGIYSGKIIIPLRKKRIANEVIMFRTTENIYWINMTPVCAKQSFRQSPTEIKSLKGTYSGTIELLYNTNSDLVGIFSAKKDPKIILGVERDGRSTETGFINFKWCRTT